MWYVFDLRIVSNKGEQFAPQIYFIQKTEWLYDFCNKTFGWQPNVLGISVISQEFAWRKAMHKVMQMNLPKPFDFI